MDVITSRNILSFSAVKDKPIDRTYFFKDKARRFYSYFSKAFQEMYSGVWGAFAFDHVDMNDLKNAMLPIVSSGAMLLVGDQMTKKLSQYYTDSDEYDFVFKFLLAVAILSIAALHRITDKKTKTTDGFSMVVGSEVMAIVFLYSSSFQTTQFLLNESIPGNYSFIMGIGAAGWVVPGSAAYAARQIQNRLLKREYARGAQRSDTALMAAGLTSVTNTFFQIHYDLFSQMTLSRLFQIVLIFDAMVHEEGLKQIRDLPSFCADMGPPIIKNWLAQLAKLAEDLKNNSREYLVLRFSKKGSSFVKIQGYQLRTGDLVLCDKKMDFSSMPISGEIVFLEQNPETLEFYPRVVSKKVSTNLQKHNGESNRIELQTKSSLDSSYKNVDLHAIHSGKQAAVLVGSELDLHGEKNIFIQIKPAKERTMSGGYEKKSVILDLITQHKQKSVLYSMLLSVIFGAIVAPNLSAFPATTLRFMFHVFHMMIPFSETLLREMIARRLMKKMNSSLGQDSMEMIDAFRVVDFCNALAGYYSAEGKKQELVIVSDKTGTLTTSEMSVMGIWTSDMKPDAQTLLGEEKNYLLPDQSKQFACAEMFAWLFTNQKKELEPEEFAIKQFFSEVLGDQHFLTCYARGNNHFRKKIIINNTTKEVDTWHLGLYKQLGGRLTLVEDGKKKYLGFFGVPNAENFEKSSLLDNYSSMQTRKGVLTRDWGMGCTEITDETFFQLKNFFDNEDKNAIKEFVCQNKEILQKFSHGGTSLVNNPLKKEAEKFIERCLKLGVLVVVATGDTAKAAKNVGDILYSFNAGKSVIINNKNIQDLKNKSFGPDSTIIFSGVNEPILDLYSKILALPIKDRPIVIFSEMSTEDKGILAAFLKAKGSFVAVNGDGSNDIAMMQEADVVFAHKTNQGTYAPGVENFANLNDRQLQKMFNSNKSFYELFDIHSNDSQFIKKFAELANSAEKAVLVLQIKLSKMGFEFAKMFGFSVKEMWQQHWFSALYDLGWLLIAFHEINESTDRPMDNKHLCASDLSMKLRLAAFTIAVTQATTTYLLTGESTNIYCMGVMLGFLPLVLKSLFSAFGQVQDEQLQRIEGSKEEKSVHGDRFRLFNWRPQSDSALYQKKNSSDQQIAYKSNTLAGHT